MTTHDHSVRYTANEFIEPDAIVGYLPTAHHFSVVWHDHDFYELAIVESGTGNHVSTDGSEAIGRGTVVFVPPGVGHEYRGCQGMRIYNCFFRAELDEFELAWAFRDEELRTLFNPTGASVTRSLRTRVIGTLEEPELAQVIAALELMRTTPSDVRTRAWELARLLLVLDLIAKAHRTADRSTNQWPLAPALVTAALDALEHDLSYPWTLNELSARLCVGPSHLARTFGRSVGLPPMHYLMRRRGERAAALLAGTDQPVSVIGSAVGWPDPSLFSRRFRAVFGVSPRAYRHRHRQDSEPAIPA